ncbi:MAG: hypothetical protein U0R29_05210 [Solirubrobacterales bacterium]
MNDAFNRLVASNPVGRPASPPDGLLETILTSPSNHMPSRRGIRRWLIRGSLVMIAALVVGGSVSWATTGVDFLDRIEGIWGIDSGSGLSSDPSGFGLEQISVLEPMSEEGIDELPERLNLSLVGARSQPVHRDGELKLALSPGRISGWGHTTTVGGNGVPSQRVDVASMNGQICVAWTEVLLSRCGSLKETRERGLSITLSGDSADQRWTSGLVSDEIVSLRLMDQGQAEVPIRDNVFQFNEMPREQTFLLGRDQNGSVVTRILIPGGLSECEKTLAQAIKRWTKDHVGPRPEPSSNNCSPG